jgi:hypothetical protein
LLLLLLSMLLLVLPLLLLLPARSVSALIWSAYAKPLGQKICERLEALKLQQRL